MASKVAVRRSRKGRKKQERLITQANRYARELRTKKLTKTSKSYKTGFVDAVKKALNSTHRA